MAHLNITPKVDLSGLPQYAANDKTGSVSDAKYVSGENDIINNVDQMFSKVEMTGLNKPLVQFDSDGI